MNIPFAKPDIGKKEIDAVVEVLKSGWLTTGPKVRELEEAFAEYVGAHYAIAVDSGTSALFLSLKCLDLAKGTTVYVPSLTFTASAATIIHAGYTPEFVDIDDDLIPDFVPDPAVIVHLTGTNACEEPSVCTIQDSAHRVERDQFRGQAGMACFSFYPTKNLASCEGGMIVTNDKEQADWLRLARSHGQTKDNYKRYAIGGSDHWEYSIDFPGWKMNMTDVQAAIALVQLEKMDKMNKKRRRIVHKYNTAFNMNRKGLHLYPIEVDNRKDFIARMHEKGVSCSVHFLPLHTMPAYKEYYEPLPMTERIGKRLVSLPLYSSMTDKEVNYVIKSVKESL